MFRKNKTILPLCQSCQCDLIFFFLPIFICLCLDFSEVKHNTVGELARVIQILAMLNLFHCSEKKLLLVEFHCENHQTKIKIGFDVEHS